MYVKDTMIPEKLVTDIEALGGEVFLVGGALRDELRVFCGQYLEGNHKDFDYVVTKIELEKLHQLAEKYGKVDTIGRIFGIVRLIVKGVTIDLALPRKENSTGPKHKDFEILSDPNIPIEDDLIRRDFTINAIARKVGSKVLIDPLGGLTDIKERRIRAVSSISFEEDPLRLLRACQFAARFDYMIEDGTLAQMIKSSLAIKHIPKPRVKEELDKLLLKAKKPSIGFVLMHKASLLEHILPDLAFCVNVGQRTERHKYDVFVHQLIAMDYVGPNLLLRWSALLHDIGKPVVKKLKDGKDTFYGHEIIGAQLAYNLLKNLTYSIDFANQVKLLVANHMFSYPTTDHGLRRFLKRIGVTNFENLFTLRMADRVGTDSPPLSKGLMYFHKRTQAEIHKHPPLEIKDLAVSGKDIMNEFNIPEGKQIGIVLEHLFKKTLHTPEFNSRPALIELARTYIETQPSAAKA